MSSVHKQRKNVRDRLVRAEGHICGIIKMIDEEKECPDILIQTGAEAALGQPTEQPVPTEEPKKTEKKGLRKRLHL